MEYAYLALAVVLNVAAYIVFKVISARAHDTVWYSLFGVGLALGAVVHAGRHVQLARDAGLQQARRVRDVLVAERVELADVHVRRREPPQLLDRRARWRGVEGHVVGADAIAQIGAPAVPVR